MSRQLAGTRGAVAGIVVGSFTSCEPKDAKESERLFRESLRKMKVPVGMGLPIGHTACNATLLQEALAEVDIDKASCLTAAIVEYCYL
ncbi:MAG TPA: hypothetical protein VH592_21655 [Gemmataceae bacterium]|jgi:muramoyltetrapeptide carboxypeptidase LdcA involved in peptidoglycan recycling